MFDSTAILITELDFGIVGQGRHTSCEGQTKSADEGINSIGFFHGSLHHKIKNFKDGVMVQLSFSPLHDMLTIFINALFNIKEKPRYSNWLYLFERNRHPGSC